MTDRASFLERVRRATSTAGLPPHGTAPPVIAPPELDHVDLVGEFIEQLLAVDGEAHRVGSSAVAATVVEIVQNHERGAVMMAHDDTLPVSGVGAALSAAGVEMVDPTMPRRGHARHNPSYATVTAGVTGAVGALAESGSIIVTSGPARPRMASLVGLLHVALLRSSAIHPSLTHLVVDRPELLAAEANVVVITGPSRTGDIEQNLNLGVHGPRHLHVVVIEDL